MPKDPCFQAMCLTQLSSVQLGEEPSFHRISIGEEPNLMDLAQGKSPAPMGSAIF